MRKEKFHLEYVFNKASKSNLWSFLSTPSGLSEWFADNVSLRENIYTFVWDKFSENAELLMVKQDSSVRFRWIEDDNPEAFFEFKIHTDELTGAIILEITDYSDPEEKEESIVLWDNQIQKLKRTLGI